MESIKDEIVVNEGGPEMQRLVSSQEKNDKETQISREGAM